MHRSRGILTAVAATAVAATALAVSAWSGGLVSAASPSAERSPSAAGEEILIGAVGPLSQPGDVDCGNATKWAVEQAAADINAKGGLLGRPVRVVFYGTETKPDVSATVVKRLTEEDKVVAVVGECHSGAALAQISIFNAAKTPGVFLSMTYTDAVTAGDPSNPDLHANPPAIFASRRPPADYYGFVVDWLRNGAGVKNVA